jgi:SAM-dependent methyltransferase
MMPDVTSEPPPHLTFYHTVEYAPGRRTAGWPVVVPIVELIMATMRRLDFAGKRVLDIGCRDGALAFEAERLGAATVLGVDIDLPVENIAFLKQALGSKAEFVQHNLYDLAPETIGLFDIVLLPGVLYHLRYPFLGLRRMRDLLPDGGMLLVETGTFCDDNLLPLLVCPAGAESPYEPTSCSFFNIKGFTDSARSLGFEVTFHRVLMNFPPYDPAGGGPLPIDRSVFLCRRDRRLDDAAVLGYWDGRTETPKLPDWNAGSP